MTDSEIIQASVKNADKQTKESSAARVLEKGPLMFLAATSIVYGALTKGKLSDKLYSTAKAAGTAAVVYGLSKPIQTVSNAAAKKDNNKHPYMNAIASTFALLGASFLAIAGLRKGSDKLQKVFKPTADKISEIAKEGAKVVNNSSLGKLTEKVSQKAANFALNHPKASNVIGKVAIYAPFAGVLGGSIALNKALEEKKAKLAASNVNKLVLCREFAQASQCCQGKTDLEA